MLEVGGNVGTWVGLFTKGLSLETVISVIAAFLNSSEYMQSVSGFSVRDISLIRHGQ